MSNDTTPEAGETYYREHGWSGCAGSDWDTLTEATKDGWRHAERLAQRLTDQPNATPPVGSPR